LFKDEARDTVQAYRLVVRGTAKDLLQNLREIQPATMETASGECRGDFSSPQKWGPRWEGGVWGEGLGCKVLPLSYNLARDAYKASEGVISDGG
jgi:hypothetical protein